MNFLPSAPECSASSSTTSISGAKATTITITTPTNTATPPTASVRRHEFLLVAFRVMSNFELPSYSPPGRGGVAAPSIKSREATEAGADGVVSPKNTESMHILGINVYHPDVSAVLIRDGQLIAALEEERFRRVKHYAGFPTTAIRRCFEIGGIEGKDLDAIAVSRNPRANLLRKTAFVLSHSPGRALIGDRLRNLQKFQALKTPLADALSVTADKLPKIHNVEHHPAHLASAFFVSPFEEAAVCALDGFGDFVSTSMALGKDRRLKVLEKICFPHSLGMLYTAVMQYFGFLSYGDEFKVMGLAPYGQPNFVDALSRLVRLKPGGRFEPDLKYFPHWSDGVEMQWEDGYPSLGKVFSPELEYLLGPARHPQEPLTRRHEDI